MKATDFKTWCRVMGLWLAITLFYVGTAWGQDPVQDDNGNYLIGTADQLEWLANKVNSDGGTYNVKLTADIDYSTKTTMIGYNQDKPYMGIFDGQFHTVKVKFETSTDGTALFRYIAASTVRNLRVTGELKGVSRTAGIAGYAIKKDNSSNGLLFSNCETAVYIHDCTSECSSGILGDVGTVSSTIESCIVKGSFKNLPEIGGFIGWRGGGPNINISNCFMVASSESINVGSTGNNQNFIRGYTANIGSNCFYLNAINNDTQGAQKDVDYFKSAAAATVLGGAWEQGDPCPVFNKSSINPVYQVKCIVGENTYMSYAYNQNIVFPYPDGYTYQWYDAEAGGTLYTVLSTVTKDLVLYGRDKQQYQFTLTSPTEQKLTYQTAMLEYDLSTLLSDDAVLQCGVMKYEVKSESSLPEGLSLDEKTGKISGTPTKLGRSTTTIVVTAANTYQQETDVSFSVVTGLTITPKAQQYLYQGEPILYDSTGVIGDDTPLTGSLALEGTGESRKIIQGSLKLNEQDGKNYTLTFITGVTATYYDTDPKEVDVELTAPGENGWYNSKDGVTFTAPDGFQIQPAGSEVKADPEYSASFVYTTEGDYTVKYNLRRTTTKVVYPHEQAVKYDATAPALKGGAPTVSNLVATFTLTDAGSGIASYSYTLDDGSKAEENGVGGKAEYSFQVTGKAGQHEMELKVTDAVGNTETYSGITFELKDAPPYVPPVSYYYTVTLPEVEGATLSQRPGGHTVEEGYDFSFTLTLDAAYDQSVPVVTTSRGETLTPDIVGRYRIRNVEEDITVSITGIFPNDDPTANAAIAGEVQVKAIGSVLYIYTPNKETVSIFTLTGTLLKQQCTAGSTEIRLPAGMYLIRVEGRTYKVVIR